MTRPLTELAIKHTDEEFLAAELNSPAWDGAADLRVTTNWNGSQAASGRHFRTRLLWAEKALYIRFEASLSEPLVISEDPDLGSKTVGLWERDVCEIFIAPDRNEPRKYFEFEVAPTGEWLDLAVDSTSSERETDWNYTSGMERAAVIESDRVVMAMRIPWEAFDGRPIEGDVWLGNIFRCVGAEPNRGYLAWRPTMTDTPNFHVPEKFGEFKFVE